MVNLKIILKLHLFCCLWIMPAAGQELQLTAAGDGRIVRLADLTGISFVAMISPDDCPTCYEFLLSEIGRLLRVPGWKGRWIAIVPVRSTADVEFSRYLQDHYDPPCGIFMAGRDELHSVLKPASTRTPVVCQLNADGTLSPGRTVTPGSLGYFSGFVDSLYLEETHRSRR